MSYRFSMRISPICPALTVVCLCVSASQLLSQSRVLPPVSFTGAPVYTQAELLSFTGLKPGAVTAQQKLDDAAQRLTDTGLFEEVTYAGSDKGIVYSLKPAKATRSASYSNFVLWPEDELDRGIKARVPLYRATAVPINGNMEDEIRAALTAMLQEKGIAGATISLMPEGPHLVFSIASPSVRIRSLTLNGASPAMQPKIDHIPHEMTGQLWDNESFKDISVRVGDDYRNDGYRDVALVKQEHSAPAITPTASSLT